MVYIDGGSCYSSVTFHNDLVLLGTLSGTLAAIDTVCIINNVVVTTVIARQREVWSGGIAVTSQYSRPPVSYIIMCYGDVSMAVCMYYSAVMDIW